MSGTGSDSPGQENVPPFLDSTNITTKDCFVDKEALVVDVIAKGASSPLLNLKRDNLSEEFGRSRTPNSPARASPGRLTPNPSPVVKPNNSSTRLEKSVAVSTPNRSPAVNPNDSDSWRERNAVITIDDHHSNVIAVRQIVHDIVDDAIRQLPVEENSHSDSGIVEAKESEDNTLSGATEEFSECSESLATPSEDIFDQDVPEIPHNSSTSYFYTLRSDSDSKVEDLSADSTSGLVFNESGLSEEAQIADPSSNQVFEKEDFTQELSVNEPLRALSEEERSSTETTAPAFLRQINANGQPFLPPFEYLPITKVVSPWSGSESEPIRGTGTFTYGVVGDKPFDGVEPTFVPDAEDSEATFGVEDVEPTFVLDAEVSETTPGVEDVEPTFVLDAEVSKTTPGVEDVEPTFVLDAEVSETTPGVEDFEPTFVLDAEVSETTFVAEDVIPTFVPDAEVSETTAGVEDVKPTFVPKIVSEPTFRVKDKLTFVPEVAVAEAEPVPNVAEATVEVEPFEPTSVDVAERTVEDEVIKQTFVPEVEDTEPVEVESVEVESCKPTSVDVAERTVEDEVTKPTFVSEVESLEPTSVDVAERTVEDEVIKQTFVPEVEITEPVEAVPFELTSVDVTERTVEDKVIKPTFAPEVEDTETTTVAEAKNQTFVPEVEKVEPTSVPEFQDTVPATANSFFDTTLDQDLTLTSDSKDLKPEIPLFADLSLSVELSNASLSSDETVQSEQVSSTSLTPARSARTEDFDLMPTSDLCDANQNLKKTMELDENINPFQTKCKLSENYNANLMDSENVEPIVNQSPSIKRKIQTSPLPLDYLPPNEFNEDDFNADDCNTDVDLGSDNPDSGIGEPTDPNSNIELSVGVATVNRRSSEKQVQQKENKSVTSGRVTPSTPDSISALPNQSEAGPEVAQFTQEEFRCAAEVFKDPSAFEFLQKAGNNKVFEESALSRLSLYVKFDPLVKKSHTDPTKPSVEVRIDPLENKCEEKGGEEVGAAHPPNQQQQLNKSNIIDLNSPKNVAKASPKMVPVEPVQRIGEESIEKKENTKVGSGLLSEDDVKKAIQYHEIYYNQRLIGKDKEISQHKHETQRLKREMEALFQTLQATRQSYHEVVSMVHVWRGKKEEEKRDLLKERDQSLEDLQSVETAFSDLHRRYEKSKSILESYKQKEDELRQQLVECQEKIRTQEQMYDLLRSRTEEKLESANTEIEQARKTGDSDHAVMKAQLMKAEMKVSSLERTLDQKNQEFAQLSQIYDDLIARFESQRS